MSDDITNIEITKLLVLKARFSQDGATLVAKKVENMRVDIKEAFYQWLKSGKEPEITVEGFTMHNLVDLHGLEPVASFLTLDWLAREPAKAKQSLTRGYDEIRNKRSS